MSNIAIRAALVGADNLLGREIKEALESSRENVRIESFASNGEANFGDEVGEAVYRQAITGETLADVDVVVLAGGTEGTAKAREAVKGITRAPRFIDCIGTLDLEPDARIATPWLESETQQTGQEQGSVVVVAQPAATMLAAILSGLTRSGHVVRAVTQIFEPASEQGKQGVGELQQQTTSLLSFKPLEKKVYDAQLSFAMLPAYGDESGVSLIMIEQRIERHLATLLSRQKAKSTVPAMPSIRVIQAPVFHGYTISGWFEFEALVSISAVEKHLFSDEVDVRSVGHEAPTNVGIAGQSGLVIGDIRADSNNPRAIWLWAVADNLRLVADSVSRLIREMAGRK